MTESIAYYQNRHEQLLQRFIEQADIPADRIKKAIHYSLFPGGKRLRPILVYLTGQLLDVKESVLDSIALSVELTHCYSLIHDDLPAMDDDDFRRGKASCHKAFDEASAILAGDGLQALAIEVLLSQLPDYLEMGKVVSITEALVKASGPSGMVSGQSLDLTELSKAAISEAKLSKIHYLKTGKLIEACIQMPILASRARLEVKQALEKFARLLGLVFQVQDDYLDQYQNAELGKGRKSDSFNQKFTFATLHPQSVLLDKINSLYQESKQALDLFGSKTENFICLLAELQKRSKE